MYRSIPEYVKGSCCFCYNVELQKYLNNQHRAEDRSASIYHKFKVSLVSLTHMKGYGRRGYLTFSPVDLNYCPSCGKPLKKFRKSDVQKILSIDEGVESDGSNL